MMDPNKLSLKVAQPVGKCLPRGNSVVTVNQIYEHHNSIPARNRLLSSAKSLQQASIDVPELELACVRPTNQAQSQSQLQHLGNPRSQYQTDQTPANIQQAQNELVAQATSNMHSLASLSTQAIQDRSKFEHLQTASYQSIKSQTGIIQLPPSSQIRKFSGIPSDQSAASSVTVINVARRHRKQHQQDPASLATLASMDTIDQGQSAARSVSSLLHQRSKSPIGKHKSESDSSSCSSIANSPKISAANRSPINISPQHQPSAQSNTSPHHRSALFDRMGVGGPASQHEAPKALEPANPSSYSVGSAAVSGTSPRRRMLPSIGGSSHSSAQFDQTGGQMIFRSAAGIKCHEQSQPSTSGSQMPSKQADPLSQQHRSPRKLPQIPAHKQRSFIIPDQSTGSISSSSHEGKQKPNSLDEILSNSSNRSAMMAALGSFARSTGDTHASSTIHQQTVRQVNSNCWLASYGLESKAIRSNSSNSVNSGNDIVLSLAQTSASSDNQNGSQKSIQLHQQLEQHQLSKGSVGKQLAASTTAFGPEPSGCGVAVGSELSDNPGGLLTNRRPSPIPPAISIGSSLAANPSGQLGSAGSKLTKANQRRLQSSSSSSSSSQSPAIQSSHPSVGVTARATSATSTTSFTFDLSDSGESSSQQANSQRTPYLSIVNPSGGSLHRTPSGEIGSGQVNSPNVPHSSNGSNRGRRLSSCGSGLRANFLMNKQRAISDFTPPKLSLESSSNSRGSTEICHTNLVAPPTESGDFNTGNTSANDLMRLDTFSQHQQQQTSIGCKHVEGGNEVENPTAGFTDLLGRGFGRRASRVVTGCYSSFGFQSVGLPPRAASATEPGYELNERGNMIVSEPSKSGVDSDANLSNQAPGWFQVPTRTTWLQPSANSLIVVQSSARSPSLPPGQTYEPGLYYPAAQVAAELSDEPVAGFSPNGHEPFVFNEGAHRFDSSEQTRRLSRLNLNGTAKSQRLIPTLGCAQLARSIDVYHRREESMERSPSCVDKSGDGSSSTNITATCNINTNKSHLELPDSLTNRMRQSSNASTSSMPVGYSAALFAAATKQPGSPNSGALSAGTSGESSQGRKFGQWAERIALTADSCRRVERKARSASQLASKSSSSEDSSDLPEARVDLIRQNEEGSSCCDASDEGDEIEASQVGGTSWRPKSCVDRPVSSRCSNSETSGRKSAAGLLMKAKRDLRGCQTDSTSIPSDQLTLSDKLKLAERSANELFRKVELSPKSELNQRNKGPILGTEKRQYLENSMAGDDKTGCKLTEGAETETSNGRLGMQTNDDEQSDDLSLFLRSADRKREMELSKQQQTAGRPLGRLEGVSFEHTISREQPTKISSEMEEVQNRSASRKLTVLRAKSVLGLLAGLQAQSKQRQVSAGSCGETKRLSILPRSLPSRNNSEGSSKNVQSSSGFEAITNCIEAETQDANSSMKAERKQSLGKLISRFSSSSEEKPQNPKKLSEETRQLVRLKLGAIRWFRRAKSTGGSIGPTNYQDLEEQASNTTSVTPPIGSHASPLNADEVVGNSGNGANLKIQANKQRNNDNIIIKSSSKIGHEKQRSGAIEVTKVAQRYDGSQSSPGSTAARPNGGLTGVSGVAREQDLPERRSTEPRRFGGMRSGK